MCPQARAAGVRLEPEKYLGPYKLPGASNAPSYINYAPAGWTWTPGSISEVLYRALLCSKATNKNGNLVTRQDVNAEIQIAQRETKLDDILYHPVNRKEPVFDGEALAAEVACAFQRSLWVLCPRLLEDVKWNAPWSPEHTHRPYVHMRFGPGAQGDYLPVVVGLLPVLDNKPNAHWFFVQPCEQWKTTWEQLYVKYVYDCSLLGDSANCITARRSIPETSRRRSDSHVAPPYMLNTRSSLVTVLFSWLLRAFMRHTSTVGSASTSSISSRHILLERRRRHRCHSNTAKRSLSRVRKT